MKKLIKSIFALSLVTSMVACAGTEKKAAEKMEEVTEVNVEETTASINLAESNVMWSGQIVGGLKSHHGTIKLTEGEVMMKGDMITGGNFTIDMTTINPTDSNYTADKPAENLVGHLSSGDFFQTDSFPKAMFVIKSSNMEEKTVTGDLTVRGVTKEEMIKDVAVMDGAAKGKLTFNRQDYGVAFDTGAKDFVLSNDIELDITLKM